LRAGAAFLKFPSVASEVLVMDMGDPLPRLPSAARKLSRTMLTIGGLTAVAWSLLYLALVSFL
jgi:hypothetical protein